MRDLSPAELAPPRGTVAWVVLVAALAFLPSLGGGFLGDDFVYVAHFHRFAWSDWPRLFTHEWSEGLWGFALSELRPFTALSFMIDAKLHGGSALGFRLTNLVLHLSVVIAVMTLAWRYSRGQGACAVVAGLVFALHPAHAEPVSWITGRVDVLSTACAFWFWILAESWSARARPGILALSLGLLFIGVFSKEVCLFAPPLLLGRWVFTDLRTSRSVWLRRAAVIAGVVAITLIYTACRRAAFGENAAVPGSTWHNVQAWGRQLSYLGWLAPILPFQGLVEFVAPGDIAALRVVGVGILVVTLIALVVSAWKRWERLGTMLFFTSGWWLATVGGLLLVGYFSPRHLYFPTAGLAVGAGLVAAFLGRHLRLVATIAVLGWFAVGHAITLSPWVQNARLSRQAIAAVQAAARSAPPGALALVSMPGVRRDAYLWSWACPHALGAPFIERPFDYDNVFADPGCYYRPEKWAEEQKPWAALSAAPGALVVAMGEDGILHHRMLSREALATAAAQVEALRADGALQAHEWTQWLHTQAAAK